MADVQAARRYAQAAFDIATSSGAVSQWRSDLDDVAAILAESEAAALFADAKVPADQRQAFAERALDVQPLAMNLAKLLIEKSRSGDARAVAEIFNRMADGHEGIAHATVTTAVELDARQLGSIEGRLSQSLGLRVTAEAIVDPSILGGVVVRVGDRVIDGSLKTRLSRLRRNLKGEA